jgi:hypothetical protein
MIRRQRGMARFLQLLAGAAVLLLAASPAAMAGDDIVEVGVNWGSQLSHQLLPDSVVKMLKKNGIARVKMFDADPWPVGALVDSGIEVMLGIPNDMLETMSSSYGNAQDWVKENVTAYGDKLKVKYVTYICLSHPAKPFMNHDLALIGFLMTNKMLLFA